MRKYLEQSNCMPPGQLPPPFRQVAMEQIEPLYQQMRDAIIAQRYRKIQLENQELRAQLAQWQEEKGQLQELLSRSALEKVQSTDQERQTILELQEESAIMGSRLDELVEAFEQVDNGSGGQWNFMAMAAPYKLIRFREALKGIVDWWQSDDDELPPSSQSTSLPPTPPTSPRQIEQDRRDRPQLHDDPASMGRSLLDR